MYHEKNVTFLSLQKHGHTPYLVILYKCLQRWKESHGGAAPKNYREKQGGNSIETILG